MFQRWEPTAGVGHVTGDVRGSGRFTVYDQGAQITDWTPGDVPVIWTSEYARFAPVVAIRGGMPICFPWFAKGRHENKSPSHGFARLCSWKLHRAIDDGGVTRLEWQLTEAGIPEIEGIERDRNRFDLRCLQEFAETLTVTLKVRNTDSHPLVVEEALHTYFHVGDIREVTIQGLGGAECFDKLTGAYDTQIGPVTVAGEFDRIYWRGEVTEIHDPVLGRAITIATKNAGNTVVWNPGPEKAADLSDFGDDEWTGMVCVETANIRDNVLHLNPGQTHDLTVRISIREL